MVSGGDGVVPSELSEIVGRSDVKELVHKARAPPTYFYQNKNLFVHGFVWKVSISKIQNI